MTGQVEVMEVEILTVLRWKAIEQIKIKLKIVTWKVRTVGMG